MNVDSIQTTAVIGTGIMGQGIIQSFAEAGLKVRVVDIDREKLDFCMNQVMNNLRQFKSYDLLKEDPETIHNRIEGFLLDDLDNAIAGAQIVVETVPEKLEIKRDIFARLDNCPPDTILCSNTSSFPVGELAQECKSKRRIIGTHFFNPAHIMPLVEIHYSSQTDGEVIATTKAFLERTGKKAVIVKKDIPGLLGTRLQLSMAREIEALLEQDVASPEDIDIACKASYGFRYACIGNLEAYDMVGLETMVAVENRIFKDLSNAAGPSRQLTTKVDKGDLGLKTGRGWFDYSGRKIEDVLEDQNRRLLRQLATFRDLDKPS